MRSKKEWNTLLGDNFFKKYDDIIIINKNVRCQYITPSNLGETNYEKIKDVINK